MRLLRELLGRREDLIGMRTAERNRWRQAVEPRVRQSIAKMLRSLDKHLAEVEQQLDDFFTQQPELGTLTRREAAALAGLARRLLTHLTSLLRGWPPLIEAFGPTR